MSTHSLQWECMCDYASDAVCGEWMPPRGPRHWLSQQQVAAWRGHANGCARETGRNRVMRQGMPTGAMRTVRMRELPQPCGCAFRRLVRAFTALEVLIQQVCDPSIIGIRSTLGRTGSLVARHDAHTDQHSCNRSICFDLSSVPDCPYPVCARMLQCRGRRKGSHVGCGGERATWGNLGHGPVHALQVSSTVCTGRVSDRRP